MDKIDLVQQTKLAFDLVEKLYFEVSYLIKEMEVLLYAEPEQFIIGRPSGYGITTRNSAGLEANYVSLWPLRKLAVFFVPKAQAKLQGGTTITKLEEAKVIYTRVILHDKNLSEPTVLAGVLYGFSAKRPNLSKVEQVMSLIEYGEAKIVGNPSNISFEDAYVSFEGQLVETNLFDLNNAHDIENRLIRPSLGLFRNVIR